MGRLFRPDAEPLLPNWRHLPVGYHGRAGTVVVSGTDVVRAARAAARRRRGRPAFGAVPPARHRARARLRRRRAERAGEPVPLERFAEHVFGVVLVNDWSARDIQAWEYVPLGPFLGKSFPTSISAWVTPLALLEERRVAAPPQEPPPLPHLAGGRDWALDLDARGRAQRRGRLARQRAHALLDDAAAARARDLERRVAPHRRPHGLGHDLGRRAAAREGSLIELTRNGAEPLQLSDGGERTFLEDGDEVVLRGEAPGLQLGEVRGRVIGPG